jgi:ubiquitin-conjugating enzyme E2 D/E
MSAAKRILREAQLLKNYSMLTLTYDENNIFEWNCFLHGPLDTPYEDGIFEISITFPQEYPFSCPSLKFKTKVYHMNISETGEVCLKGLEWSPKLTVKNIFEYVVNLMILPNPDDPLVPEVANLYKINKERHDEVAKTWTRSYASKNEKDNHLYKDDTSQP